MSFKNRSGMTLIEVMISMVVFIVGVMGVLGMLGVATVNNAKSRNGTIARELALARLDHLERLTATNPALSPCPTSQEFCYSESPLDDRGAVSPIGKYQRSYDVKQVPAPPGLSDYLNIRVRVQWQDAKWDVANGQGRHSIVYQTMLVP